jgi:hypothetical protein
MSRRSRLFSWRSVIVGSTLLPSVRHVALTLSLLMNDQGGSCRPSLVTVARETGLHKETVTRAIQDLEASGFLAVDRGGGRGRSTHYTATFPKRVG